MGARALAAALLFSSLPGVAAESPRTEDPLEQLGSAERSARIGNAIASSVIGASLFIAPQFSDSLSGSSKVFFALGGVTVLMNGIKNFIVPTQTERMIESYSQLRMAPQSNPATRKLYEDSFFRDVASASRTNRHWQAAISLAAGATSVIAGALQDNEFAKNFSMVLGATSILGGTFALLGTSPSEKAAEIHSTSATVMLEPALIATREGALPGIQLGLRY